MKNKQEVTRIEQSDAFVDRALQEYQRELISLGRLAELLGVDRMTAGEIVEARGIRIRFAPTSVEEALQDARVARALSDS